MTQLIDKAAADYARETLAQPDYPTYNDEYEIMRAFEAGAEWANKQFEKERLDKMYEWLKENIMDYAFVHSYSSNVNIDIDTLIEDLQKAMKEEV